MGNTSKIGQTILALVGAGLCVACGAANKSASDVLSIFDGPAPTIQDKATSICQTLRQRTESPSTRDFALPVLDTCAGAGTQAVELNTMTGIKVQKLQWGAGGEEEKLRTTVRMQLWLNRPLIGLTAMAVNASKFTSGGNITKNLGMNVPDIGIKDAIKFDMAVVEPLNLDITRGVLGSMVLGIKTTGLATIDAKLRMGFGVFDRAIAVVADTPDASGVLKDISIVMLVIPHANDTYFDMVMSVALADILEDNRIMDNMLPPIIESLFAMLFDINLKQRKIDSGEAVSLTLINERGVHD